MIIENRQHRLRSLSNGLDGLSYSPQLLSENDTQVASDRVKVEDIDLLIVDGYLQGKLDGFDLCRSIRSSGSQIPIILVLSGYLSLERFKAIAAGADLLLYRPIIKEELIKMTELLLGLKYATEPDPILMTHMPRRLESAV
jgi:two-component system, OmpR family, response regulator MprA